MVKIGISGACGKMGKRIISLAEEEGFILAFGLEEKGHPDLGKIRQGVRIEDDPREIKNCDCLIEFTNPSATIEHLSFLVKFNKSAVIGTTGLDEVQQEKVKEAAEIIPIVFSPNMSVGVNLLFKLIEEAAKILKGYDVDIQEAHHIHKKDAPSGTAKKIAQLINNQDFNVRIEDIKADRVNEVVGDHKVIFESKVDKIELFHSAKTRDIFAQGALLAAKWIINRPRGLYSMDDVLFHKE